jgi:hypothetical protein
MEALSIREKNMQIFSQDIKQVHIGLYYFTCIDKNCIIARIRCEVVITS